MSDQNGPAQGPDTGAVALFDSALRLESWSAALPNVLDIDPGVLKERPGLGTILGVSRDRVEGYHQRRRYIQTNTREASLAVLRGEVPGLLDSLVGVHRRVRTEIAPLGDGRVATYHFERSYADAAAAEQAARAQAEAATLRSLLETAPTGVMIASTSDGTMLFANSRLAELLKVPSVTTLMASYTDAVLFQGDRDFLLQDLRQNGRLRDFEMTITDAEGRKLWLLMWIEAISFEGESAILYWCLDISRLKQTEAQLTEQALHDDLTGLANRGLLESHLHLAMAHAKRTGLSGALLFLDLDGFKAINDSYGHEAGDHVLITVAQRLRAGLRGSDTPARLAGDEFVVVLQDLTRPTDAGVVADKILAGVAEPISWGTMTLTVGASVGICLFAGDETDQASLLSAADKAMYAAKQAGKGVYRYAVSPEAFARNPDASAAG